MAESKYKDLKDRLIFVLLAIVVFRIGVHIPVPGIDYPGLRSLFSQGDDLLSFFNLFTGGALSNASIMALGIFPYITASIIMNLASLSFKRFEAMRKEGSQGAQKINSYARLLTVPLALFQSYGLTLYMESQQLVFDPGLLFRVQAMTYITGGSIFLMWLGEQITERGLGNGISLLIFASIVSSIPTAFGQLFSQVQTGERGPIFVIGVLLGLGAMLAFVVFVERGQRRVLINQARRQLGNRMYAGQSSFLPYKVNMAGVMPAIFAYAVLSFPATFISYAGTTSLTWLRDVAAVIQQGTPLYFLLLIAAIMFFTFFWVSLSVQPKENANNLRQSGAFIPGIRPGEQTTNYLEKVITRLTFFGAVYITSVCLLPELLYSSVSFARFLGGTSILIMVVVALDFMENVQYYIISHDYGSLLKKMPGGKKA